MPVHMKSKLSLVEGYNLRTNFMNLIENKGVVSGLSIWKIIITYKRK